MRKLLAAAIVCLCAVPSRGTMVVGPWTPIFKGVEHAVGTNYQDAVIPRLQVANCVRVDLTDPDVQLFPTPPASNYVAESRETASMIVSNFLKVYRLQVATDCNWYSANPGGGSPQSEGVPCEVFGLQICTGAVVSVADSGPGGSGSTDTRYASLLFTEDKQPSFAFQNSPPGTNTAAIYTAVTGYYPILSNGVNIGAAASISYPDPTVHGAQPRTIFGVSEDNRYLLLMTIDGRQPGYSEGANDVESAMWMQQFGAWNAINMDGGGSTALYRADACGNPVALSKSSYVASYGRERIIGSHFGVYAKPLQAFLLDPVAVPGNTTADITWQTASNGSSQVEYGLTPAYGSVTPLDPTWVTSHQVTLTDLRPGTSYYYRVISWNEVGEQFSMNGCGPFRTTNLHGGSGILMGVTQSWKYSTDNLDPVPAWKTPGFDDTNWAGGPGLLWVDTTAPNPYVHPKNTQLPANPTTTYPYVTYYFRTHFTFTNSLDGVTLVFSNFIDDGAVFYLNGAELFRTRMWSGAVNNQTLASNSPCLTYPSGNPNRANATTNCADLVYLSGGSLANLRQGDNVLAVEVHNALANSRDITFGAALYYTLPPPPPPPPPFVTNLAVLPGETQATISWQTRSNSTSRVEYGLTPALGTFTPLDPALTTNHSVTLMGLELLTSYYFRVISSIGPTQYTATGTLATVPFYSAVVPLTNAWKYSVANLDGVNWRSPGFGDANWPSGPALLWVDRRAMHNPEVQPKYTALPVNPAAGNMPYTTYYFRSRFSVTNKPPGFSLVFSNFVDAGAAFYLNGREVQRLRLPAVPTTLSNATFATGQPASGDAESAEVFRLWGNQLTNLVVGTNVLAVEVHNSAATNLDITFGLSVGLVRALAEETQLHIAQSNNSVCLSWAGAYLTLQQSSDPAATNSWSDVPGPVQTSPFCLTNAVGAWFYRLRN